MFQKISTLLLFTLMSVLSDSTVNCDVDTFCELASCLDALMISTKLLRRYDFWLKLLLHLSMRSFVGVVVHFVCKSVPWQKQTSLLKLD